MVGVCVCEPVLEVLRVPESLGDCVRLGVCVELDVSVCEALIDCVNERVWVCVSLGDTVALGVCELLAVTVCEAVPVPLFVTDTLGEPLGDGV